MHIPSLDRFQIIQKLWLHFPERMPQHSRRGLVRNCAPSRGTFEQILRDRDRDNHFSPLSCFFRDGLALQGRRTVVSTSQWSSTKAFKLG